MKTLVALTLIAGVIGISSAFADEMRSDAVYAKKEECKKADSTTASSSDEKVEKKRPFHFEGNLANKY